MINKRLSLIALLLCVAVSFCGCSFENAQNKTDADPVKETTAKTDDSSTDKTMDTLPNTIDTYAKNYTEVGEVMPTQSIGVENKTEKVVEVVEAKKEGMAVYTSEMGYSIEYPETYIPKSNFDGKEFIIIDEKSGSNFNVIVGYPNILYESEETYKAALEGNDEMAFKSFKVSEYNGINAVDIELAIHGGYVYQTVYRTGEYYYILSYVQGRGVTRQFDDDMKAILKSLKLS